MHRSKFIANLVSEHDWRYGVELGVGDGRTYLYLLENCPDLDMIGVDLWEPRGDYQDTPHEANERKVRREAEKFDGRSSIWKVPTTDAANLFPDKMLDFVFIDADHSYEGVSADIRAWRPKIRSGGMLIGHDVDWPSVRRAAAKLCPGYEEGPDNLWYLTL